ncbi:hypothetical protein PHLGIDRAFT_31385 [Phlebiopsis gigantea 11061_1 CR5-6]|uniref:Uncharacterized protein n=1 Tax=Phlebiopsis gigantea (strain 11061_1 CR5-6) TaxID=745531 RepID=A0A0C3PFJ9_PHLG1|nr:hypothetical protein PHLGIDRAFT_31385 [Phlebiopsis gigantea 11061_1 CR5-6]
MASEDAHKLEIGSATETVVVAALANSSASVVTHETSTDVDDSGTGVPTAITTTTKTIVTSVAGDGEGEESVEDLLEEIGWEPRGPRNSPTAVRVKVPTNTPRPSQPTK